MNFQIFLIKTWPLILATIQNHEKHKLNVGSIKMCSKCDQITPKVVQTTKSGLDSNYNGSHS